MSEIKEEGEIMWRCGATFHDDEESAKRHKRIVSGLPDIERVRVTPEPGPERFYVEEDTGDCPFSVRDRGGGRRSVVKFWPPFADYDFIRELAKSLAARFNVLDAPI